MRQVGNSIAAPAPMDTNIGVSSSAAPKMTDTNMLSVSSESSITIQAKNSVPIRLVASSTMIACPIVHRNGEEMLVNDCQDEAICRRAYRHDAPNKQSVERSGTYFCPSRIAPAAL